MAASRLVLTSRPEQLRPRDDVGGVELAKVRERVGKLGRLNAEPLGDGDQHALPGVVRDKAAAAKIMVAARPERPGELVEDAPTLEAPTDEKVLASPSMVAAPSVAVKRPGKLRLSRENHAVPDVLRLHLIHKASQRIVDHSKSRVQVRLHHAVHVPTANGDKEEVALGLASFPGTDQLGDLLEFPLEARVCREVSLQLRFSQSPAKVL
mmetsp:Transcript_39399/g.113733  ORF Transcript_39399/g.113733 Transcript_39399/m.113733 type:complete len:209 (-) Transcript_39399:703-1329(-)